MGRTGRVGADLDGWEYGAMEDIREMVAVEVQRALQEMQGGVLRQLEAQMGAGALWPAPPVQRMPMGRGAEAGWPWGERWAFGIEFDGDLVRVYKARIHRFPNTFAEASQPKELQATAAGTWYVGWKLEAQKCETDASNAFTLTIATTDPELNNDVENGIYTGRLYAVKAVAVGDDVKVTQLLEEYVHALRPQILT